MPGAGRAENRGGRRVFGQDKGLVEAYEPLARSLARRFSAFAPWLADDFLSDALLYLWKSADSWQAEKGKFTTHAACNIAGDTRSGCSRVLPVAAAGYVAR